MAKPFLILLLFSSAAMADGGSACQGLFSVGPAKLPIEHMLTQKSIEFNESSDIAVKSYPPRPSRTFDDEQKNALISAFYKSTDLVDYTNKNFNRLSKVEKKEIEERHFHITMGLLLSASEYLSQKSIEHTITHENSFPFILISTNGSHYVNKIAARMIAKYNVRLTVDPFSMTISRSEGSYWNSLKRTVSPTTLGIGIPTLLRPSFLQNPTILHELTHALDFEKFYDKDLKPYHARIRSKNLSSNALGGYKSFSVDELLAHRTSIRTYAHNALTIKDNPYMFEVWYSRATNTVQLLISLSNAVQEAVQGRLMTAFSTTNQQRTFAIHDYTGKEKSEGLVSTFRLAQYNSKLYSILAREFEKNKTKTEEEKKVFLRKLIKVLATPEIRKMDGELPSIQEIETILD